MPSAKLKFEEIRKLAEDAGREHWQAFIGEGMPPLIDECINDRRAWMFFRNPAIEIPDEANLRKCALVVSENGEVRFTADYYPNFDECRAYLAKMADHFEERDL